MDVTMEYTQIVSSSVSSYSRVVIGCPPDYPGGPCESGLARDSSSAGWSGTAICLVCRPRSTNRRFRPNEPSAQSRSVFGEGCLLLLSENPVSGFPFIACMSPVDGHRAVIHAPLFRLRVA